MEFQEREEIEQMIRGGIDREGMDVAKALGYADCLRPKNLRAVAKLSSFELMEPAIIGEHLKREIQLCICDVDQLMAPRKNRVSPVNVDKLRDLIREGIIIEIFSNSPAGQRLLELFDDLDGQIGIHDTKYAKPKMAGFREILERRGISATNTLMAGDDPFTDGGSNRVGIEFVQVEPIPDIPGTHVSLAHHGKAASRAFAINLSALYDKILRRTPLRDEDMSTTQTK